MALAECLCLCRYTQLYRLERQYDKLTLGCWALQPFTDGHNALPIWRWIILYSHHFHFLMAFFTLLHIISFCRLLSCSPLLSGPCDESCTSRCCGKGELSWASYWLSPSTWICWNLFTPARQRRKKDHSQPNHFPPLRFTTLTCTLGEMNWFNVRPRWSGWRSEGAECVGLSGAAERRGRSWRWMSAICLCVPLA